MSTSVGLLKTISLEAIKQSKKIVLYPAASGSHYFYTFIKEVCPHFWSSVICLGDGDKALEGQQFLEREVVSPQKLASIDPEFVLVASANSYKSIHRELEVLLSKNCQIIDVNCIEEYILYASRNSQLATNVDVLIDNEELDQALSSLPPWFVSMPFGQGRFTQSEKGAYTYHLLDCINLSNDLSGKSVLDLGASDGFYSFECAARGASHVVAVDGPWWMQGKQIEKFYFAKNVFNLEVESRVSFVEEFLSNQQKPFDVTLCLGLYYHLKDPFWVFRKLRETTRERLIVSGRFLVNDISDPMGRRDKYEKRTSIDGVPYMVMTNVVAGKWHANLAGLKAMLISSGFSNVEFTFTLATPESAIGSFALSAS